MVAITRGNPRQRRRVMGGKKQSSSPFTLRNFCFLLVILQGLRLLTMDEKELETFEESVKKLEQKVEDEIRNDIGGQLGNFRGSVAKKPTPAPVEKKKTVVEQDHHEAFQSPDVHDVEPEESEESDDEEENKEKEPEKEEIKDSANNKNDLNPIVLEKKGTGPTKVGYVKDFVDERANPAYKHIESPIVDASAEVAKMTNEKSAVACFDESTGTINEKCLDHDTPLIAYNSESFARTWCDQEIGPKSAVVMAEHCTDPVSHIFPSQVPSLKGEHMPSIIVKKSEKPSATEEVTCDIPCLQETGLNFGVNDEGKTYSIDGEPWKISVMDERMTRGDYIKDHYYSSYSLVSSVPLSQYDQDLHSLRKSVAVDFDTVENKAIYLVSGNCNARSTKRNRWFDAVNAKVKVDSFGDCGHNAEVPEGETIKTPEGRIALSKKYKMVLAFDSSNGKDYITNVVWEAFASGAIPVVSGADNIATRFPVHSFINVKDFDKWDDLAEYVEKVMSDKELWMSYHKWRDDDEAIEKVLKQNEFAKTGPTCRLCRWAYAKKYGLGWDHANQEVRPVPKVPKEKLCTTADHGLVSKPFVESWVTRTSAGDVEKVFEEDADLESCSSLSVDGGIAVGTYKGKRKVVQHDGVTDFIVTESLDDSENEETSLRLTFPGVRNPDGAFFHNTHTTVSTAKGARVSSASIQDLLVKITVLANWDTTVKSTGEGIMEVVIKNDNKSITSNDAPRRVRVIIEELNPVVDKMTEFFPSSYCKQMTKDFIEPIGVYFVDS